MTTGVNSSLIGLTRRDANRLKELSVSMVLVSLMAPTAEAHDMIAQRSGSFAATIYGIRLLQHAGVPVDVNMVISQKNKEYLRETMWLVKSLGLRHFNATRAGCPGNCHNFRELALDIVEFREYLETLHVAGNEEKISTGVLESYPLCGMKEVQRYKSFTGRRCLAGVTTLTVAADGTVRPCSHLDVNYGNIFTDDLPTIWSRMSAWRNGSFLPDFCRDCKLIKWCGGGCRMEAKMRRGSFRELDPYAKTEDVEYASRELSHRQQERVIPLELPHAVRINPKLRIRAEQFGGVVFVGARFTCYVNSAAFQFLVGLQKGIVYGVTDLSGRFASGNQDEFLKKLIQHKILLPETSQTSYWEAHL
jgi:radical SAM protein with 4Fe4S-binding SPASM domain